MKSHHTNKLALGLATLAVIGVAAPATQAHASTVESKQHEYEELLKQLDEIYKNQEQEPEQEVATEESKIPFIDNSTAGHPFKVKVKCIDQYTGKVLQYSLVDANYSRTMPSQAPEYVYAKPVINGFTSKAYYGDGAAVPFYYSGVAEGEIEVTVEYRTSDESKMNSYWSLENGKWYYRHSMGGFAKGMSTMYGGVYCFDDTTGEMKTGWVQYKGTWYYFYSTGQRASNTTIDGYSLDSNGKIV